MRNKRKYERITKEASELIKSTHQFVSGDLDIAIHVQDYEVLGELAEDINQISSTFNEYINEISRVLAHLSAGNMAVRVAKDINYKGDFKPIKNALYKIRRSLNSSFEEINSLSEEVDRFCSQVESGASQIASSATEQANLIGDLTGTLYQITEQTSNNAESAKRASNSVNSIQHEAKVGFGYMEQMLDSIQRVQTSSQDISGIITIISGLAEQTKLLALNAAIEAARAGELGKGFSVVADEVRKLADKSAEAVGQTTTMIDHSIKIAQESVDIAYKTAESFKNINSSIENVAELCADIAEISETQASSLKDTSSIITNISGVVQNNAAYSEENYAVAENLVQLSAGLKQVLTRYRLVNQGNEVAYHNGIETLDKKYLEGVFDQLKKASGADEIDRALETAIQEQPDIECFYVIDGAGYQVSHTIMNPGFTELQDENFKPAVPGDYYAEKKYYREAMKKPAEWYTSIEYVSAATGGLCRTLSCTYEGSDQQVYLICIDIKCKF